MDSRRTAGGDYHGAVPLLCAPPPRKDLRGKDWALFVLAESEFYDGNYRGARDNFEKLAHGHGRPAQMAPFRIADCLWMEGDHAKAATSYARLAKTATARTGDVALARFRVAEQVGRARQGSGPPPVSRHRARFPGAPAVRRGAAPDRRGHARAPVDDATGPAHAADHATHRAARRGSRSHRPAEACGVAVEGPSLG